ncbi:MAG TPA: sigma-70 family RNA polymerase sigma factor [Candidatus Angelobacter sp.]|nr:sigma-70 family RNA polymerase sigma factor [Candidatus Angelobacter sp.]
MGWCEFVGRFQPTIAVVISRRLQRRRLANPALVDDLVQETFLKLLGNDAKALRNFDFRHENALRGFLKVIAANAVEDHFRRKKQPAAEAEELLATVPDRQASEQFEFRLRSEEVNRVLKSQTSTREQALFWFYFREGFSAREISELPSVALSVKAVENTLLRLARLVAAELKGSKRK